MKLLTALVYLSTLPFVSMAAEKPNFVILFVDDMGYGDIGCFGNKLIRTPRLDQLAQEGTKFTHFYAQTVCGPSRSALMTGCYPLRNAKNNNLVSVHPELHSKEITLAESLKPLGYTTGCFGKWDMAGHSQQKFVAKLMPNQQGFDTFFGTPGSNDSKIRLFSNNKLVDNNADMATVTERLTTEAIKFIKANKDKPFLAYIPHPMPHIRLDASKKFKGKSKRGLYGDVIEELDYNVGRIIDTLKEESLDSNTYVLFTSDNGPWFLEKHRKRKSLKDAGGWHGGTAAPLRGHKTSAWEGGCRVPCIFWAPGKIPAGRTNSEIARTLDIFPTFTHLAGGTVPEDRVIDGRDISGLIHCKEGAKSPSNQFLFYRQTQLAAVRNGKWKLHLPADRIIASKWNIFSTDGDVPQLHQTLLYDLEKDPAETTNLAESHPQIVEQLTAIANEARQDIGDYNVVGKNARFYDPGKKRPDIKK